MKRILIALLLTLGCSITALASDITIASTTVSNFIGPTTGVELRGFLSSTLTVPSGTPLAFTANSGTDLLTIPGHTLVVGNALYLSIGTAGVLPTGLTEGVRYYAISVSGNDVGISTTAGGAAINFTSNGSGTIYVLTATTSYPASSPTTGVTQWRFACTVSSSVVGGITVYTLTIPAITIPATTNAVSGYGARWTFYFYRNTGVKISVWSGYESLRIPTSAVSTSWDAIKIYNNDTIATADVTTYTKSEIDALLISCCAGGGGLASAYTRVQEEGVDLTQRTTLNFVGGGFTAADDSTRTTLTLDPDLSAIAALTTTGFAVRTTTGNTWVHRTLTSRGEQIGISFGDGTSDNPYFYIPDTLHLGSDGTEGRLEISGPADTYSVGIMANPSANYDLRLPTTLPSSTQCLQLSVTGQISTSGAACGSGSGGAPSNARYLLTQANATLTDERILQTTAGLTETDFGAGANFEIGLDLTYAPTWTGKHTHTVGTNTTSVESMLISKANRTTDGQTDSDYLTFYGKGRSAATNYTAEWRMKVDVVDNTGISDFVLQNRINGSSLVTGIRFDIGGGITMTGGLIAGSGAVTVVNSTGNVRPEAFATSALTGAGTSYVLATATGTLTSGRCAEWNVDGNLVQASGACGGGAPAGSTGDYQINNAGAMGAGLLKDLSGGAVSFTNGSGAGGTWRAQAYTQTQITSDTNNLTAGGRSFNLYLSTDAARSVRGLTFSGFTQVDGEVHLIQNTGTFPLLLTNEDASATAANRFHTASGRTVTLLGDRAALTVWDDTIDRHRVFPLAVNAPELLHTNTTIPTVTNTTTETSLLTSTFTTPANFFTVGRTLRVLITGVITNTSTPTLRIKLKAGSTVLVDSTAVTMTTLSGSARSFTAEVAVLCTSVGASGAFDGNGQFRYNTTSNALAALELVDQAATANTTGSLTWDVTAQWGTANVQNSISVTSVVVTGY